MDETNNIKNKKPKFFGLAGKITSGIITFTLAVIGNIKIEVANDFHSFVLTLVIFIGAFIISIFIVGLIYSWRLYLYTKEIEDSYNKTKNLYNTTKNKYNKLVEEREKVSLILKSIIEKVDLAILEPSIEEVTFLKKLKELLGIDEELLRKGEDYEIK